MDNGGRTMKPMSPHHVPNKRPLLIYNHNAKAAGGSILEILDEIKECRISLDTYRSGLSLSGHAEKNCFVDATEKTHTTYNDRKHGYVIGSVREPCSQYLSLWTYGSSGSGQWMHHMKKHHHSKIVDDLYGIDGPYFNSTHDIERFHSWLRMPEVFGLMTERFYTSYLTIWDGDDNGGEVGESSLEVDCWVFVEDFQASLVSCLRRYEAQGGFVDWNATKLSTLVDMADNQTKEYSPQGFDNNDEHHPDDDGDDVDEHGHFIRRYLTHHEQQSQKHNVSNIEQRGKQNFAKSHISIADNINVANRVSKKDPIGNPQVGHHGPCHTYFDEQTSFMIENGPDASIYQTFGYSGCCKSREQAKYDDYEQLQIKSNKKNETLISTNTTFSPSKSPLLVAQSLFPTTNASLAHELNNSTTADVPSESPLLIAQTQVPTHSFQTNLSLDDQQSQNSTTVSFASKYPKSAPVENVSEYQTIIKHQQSYSTGDIDEVEGQPSFVSGFILGIISAAAIALVVTFCKSKLRNKKKKKVSPSSPSYTALNLHDTNFEDDGM
mmetsp:Transcript_20409/g.23424  ORF Transcript_20409/g.23424 Transcript_20409/m.23424 type:complete len:550 (+) Transcript_20409:43-1692(+)